MMNVNEALGLREALGAYDAHLEMEHAEESLAHYEAWDRRERDLRRQVGLAYCRLMGVAVSKAALVDIDRARYFSEMERAG